MADTTRDRPAPGTVMWVRHRGKTFAHAYGEADLREHAPVTTETVFRLGSITKIFTAAAVLQLVERGKLRFDDEITRYVDFPAAGHRITIRHLLQQTSGLRNYVQAILDGDGRFDRSKSELMAGVKDAPPDFHSGSQYAYSNTNYFLLGMIIERASGVAYQEYLEKNIFAHARLTATSTCGARRVDIAATAKQLAKDPHLVAAVRVACHARSS